jgi:WD40 repeat protein
LPPQATHGPDDELAVVGRVERRSPHAHKFLVSCVAWYPVDTGMFISGSFDQDVKLWDTNTWVVPQRPSAAGEAPLECCLPCSCAVPCPARRLLRCR